MYDARNPLVINDLWFALEVLQESAHLGLDSEYTSRLTSVILKQIERRERALNRRPSIAATSEPELEVIAS